MGKAYRTATPYRKPQTYRGTELTRPPPPGTVSAVTAPWEPHSARAAEVRAPWQAAERHDAATPLAHGEATQYDAVVAARWGVVAARDAAVALPHQPTSERLLDAAEVPWGSSDAHGSAAALPWAPTSVRDAGAWRARHRQADALGRGYALPWGMQAARSISASALWRAVTARGALVALPWGPSGHYRREYRAPYPVEPNPGEGPLTVPRLPVYVMLPSVSFVRLPERTPVELLTCSVSTDARSWGWSLEATLPASQLGLVNPDDRAEPVELEVTINGYTWVMLVESYRHNRRFGVRTASISGRGRAAILATPYAPLRSREQPADRNAAQLADEELAGTGWTLLWEAVDWLVPGGTWNYADQAPIDAIAQLAASIGARVESDRVATELRVKPSYPVSPWRWASEGVPWAILPPEIITVLDGSWQGGSNANGIYVYSEQSTFGALVKLTGTGGEVGLPMVVDRLLTMADPARERGRIELANAGRMKVEQVTLPLFPAPANPGLLPIGELVDVQESDALTWRGQVMGVRVDATRGGSSFSVRQTLQIERQFRDA